MNLSPLSLQDRNIGVHFLLHCSTQPSTEQCPDQLNGKIKDLLSVGSWVKLNLSLATLDSKIIDWLIRPHPPIPTSHESVHKLRKLEPLHFLLDPATIFHYQRPWEFVVTLKVE